MGCGGPGTVLRGDARCAMAERDVFLGLQEPGALDPVFGAPERAAGRVWRAEPPSTETMGVLQVDTLFLRTKITQLIQ